MTTLSTDNAIEILPLPRKDFPMANASQYRVYTDEAHFTIVQALSALEALRTSGVWSPYKIERESLDLTQVFNPQHWFSDMPAAPAVSEPAAAVEVPSANTEPVVAASEEVAEKSVVELPLSNDDVDKLLNQ